MPFAMSFCVLSYAELCPLALDHAPRLQLTPPQAHLLGLTRKSGHQDTALDEHADVLWPAKGARRVSIFPW